MSKMKMRNPKGMGSYRTLPNGSKQWRQRIDGEERTVTAKTASELQEKIKKIADLPIIKSKLKVFEWFDKWLDNILKLKKRATYNQYKTLYEQYIKPEIGNRRINNIKQYDIQKVISEMNVKVIQKAEYDKDGFEIKPEKIGLSTWTMKHTRKVMNIAFSKAVDDKIIPENPVYKIEIPKKQAKPRKTLNTSELKILFEYAKKTRWYWAFRFLLVTGLRRGELLALRWSDIDFESKRIIVDESNSPSGLGDTKSSEVHYVPLSEKAIYYLSQQKQMLIDEINPVLHNEKLIKQDLIFPSKTGTMMKPDSFNSVIDRINVKAGIHVTPHMFRHTFVFMSKGLLSRSELQEALGHDESTTTEDIYGTMLSDTEKVANKIDEAFNNIDAEIDKIEENHNSKVISMDKYKKAR